MSMLYEYTGNLHIHTPYSDGEAWHQTVAEAARRANLDFIVITDHNILVQGVEGYYGDDQRGYTLLLAGEEVHDQARLPQVNHALIYNTRREMAQHAADPQTLIDEILQAGGLAFLAHPADHAIQWVHESAIPWVDWNIQGYHGLEIWNYMSNFKDYLDTPRHALRNVFRPRQTVLGPSPDALKLWDDLLMTGQRVIGIGNADAHGTTFRLGPFKKVVYPYEFLFGCVNTHILTTQPLSGSLEADRAELFRTLKAGSCFISYELPGNTRGFRFSAQGQTGNVAMGGTLKLGTGVTLQILAPARAHIKLIHCGAVIAERSDHEAMTYTASKPGAYRVEVWREYLGQERCWILSNPIYIEDVRASRTY
jgi:hypothetical protein